MTQLYQGGEDDRAIQFLFGTGSGTFIPRKIRAVTFLQASEFLRLFHFKVPLVLLAISDSVFQIGEFHDGVGQGIASRTPSHQTVFPSFPGVPLDAPLSSGVSTALHGILGWHKNPDATVFDVELGNARQRGHIFLNGANNRDSFLLVLG